MIHTKRDNNITCINGIFSRPKRLYRVIILSITLISASLLFAQKTIPTPNPIRQNHAYIPLSDSAIYALIDSLERDHDRKKRRIFEKELAEGYLPVGAISLRVNRLINYNSYEGFKPVLGLKTNQHLSGNYSVGGFYSRSIKSKDNNYGAFVQFFFNPQKSDKLELAFQKDLNETGFFSFLDAYSAFSDERFRMFSTESVDLSKQISLSYTGQLSSNLRTEWSYNYTELAPMLYYPFLTNNQLVLPELKGHEAALRMKWQTPRDESISQTDSQIVPALWANIRYAKGNSSLPYDYLGLETQLETSLRLSTSLTSSLRLTAGNISGDLKASHLYSAFGTRGNLIGLESRYSFATMRPAEFAAGTFALAFVRASLQIGTKKEKGFKPLIIFSSSAGWANIPNSFKGHIATFNKGYYESGIYFADLLKHSILSYGIAFHYRYGPYQLQEHIDNLAIKIGLSVKL